MLRLQIGSVSRARCVKDFGRKTLFSSVASDIIRGRTCPPSFENASTASFVGIIEDLASQNVLYESLPQNFSLVVEGTFDMNYSESSRAIVGLKKLNYPLKKLPLVTKVSLMNGFLKCGDLWQPIDGRLPLDSFSYFNEMKSNNPVNVAFPQDAKKMEISRIFENTFLTSSLSNYSTEVRFQVILQTLKEMSLIGLELRWLSSSSRSALLELMAQDLDSLSAEDALLPLEHLTALKFEFDPASRFGTKYLNTLLKHFPSYDISQFTSLCNGLKCGTTSLPVDVKRAIVHKGMDVLSSLGSTPSNLVAPMLISMSKHTLSLATMALEDKMEFIAKTSVHLCAENISSISTISNGLVNLGFSWKELPVELKTAINRKVGEELSRKNIVMSNLCEIICSQGRLKYREANNSTGSLFSSTSSPPSWMNVLKEAHPNLSDVKIYDIKQSLVLETIDSLLNMGLGSSAPTWLKRYLIRASFARKEKLSSDQFTLLLESLVRLRQAAKFSVMPAEQIDHIIDHFFYRYDDEPRHYWLRLMSELSIPMRRIFEKKRDFLMIELAQVLKSNLEELEANAKKDGRSRVSDLASSSLKNTVKLFHGLDLKYNRLPYELQGDVNRIIEMAALEQQPWSMEDGSELLKRMDAIELNVMNVGKSTSSLWNILAAPFKNLSWTKNDILSEYCQNFHNLLGEENKPIIDESCHRYLLTVLASRESINGSNYDDVINNYLERSVYLLSVVNIPWFSLLDQHASPTAVALKDEILKLVDLFVTRIPGMSPRQLSVIVRGLSKISFDWTLLPSELQVVFLQNSKNAVNDGNLFVFVQSLSAISFLLRSRHGLQYDKYRKELTSDDITLSMKSDEELSMCLGWFLKNLDTICIKSINHYHTPAMVSLRILQILDYLDIKWRSEHLCESQWNNMEIWLNSLTFSKARCFDFIEKLRLLEFPAVALGDDVRDRLLTTITTNLPDANYSDMKTVFRNWSLFKDSPMILNDSSLRQTVFDSVLQVIRPPVVKVTQYMPLSPMSLSDCLGVLNSIDAFSLISSSPQANQLMKKLYYYLAFQSKYVAFYPNRVSLNYRWSVKSYKEILDKSEYSEEARAVLTDIEAYRQRLATRLTEVGEVPQEISRAMLLKEGFSPEDLQIMSLVGLF